MEEKPWEFPLYPAAMREKAKSRKRLSKRHEEHDLRRQAHRNAAKQTPCERKIDTDIAPKFLSSRSSALSDVPSSYWDLTHYKLSNKASCREYKALKTLPRIYTNQIDHPDVSSRDPTGKYFWIRFPRLRWIRLFKCVKVKLPLDSLLQLEQALLDYIGPLYSLGVEYKVDPDQLFPLLTKKCWVLFLGGWWNAEYHMDKSILKTEEWKQKEMAQRDKIKRIFAEARQIYHKSADRREKLDKKK
ncbi:hypothetical protein N7456_007898 [Penicillium angulare]|uniref:Uncharacterized protein n=1 Tax=Penicillium angulare TaxID=116970 RepID=A0A9W9FC08_9EURO|nr:hypothetical protein N7456_007898 [Penicillium angulare]